MCFITCIRLYLWLLWLSARGKNNAVWIPIINQTRLNICLFVHRDFVSDFELMLAKKKAEQGGRRKRRKDVELINDNDDLIAALIQKMKQCAEVGILHNEMFCLILFQFHSFNVVFGNQPTVRKEAKSGRRVKEREHCNHFFYVCCGGRGGGWGMVRWGVRVKYLCFHDGLYLPATIGPLIACFSTISERWMLRNPKYPQNAMFYIFFNSYSCVCNWFVWFSQEDRELNRSKQPATRKLCFLPKVVNQLNKWVQLVSFLEFCILNLVFTDRTNWRSQILNKKFEIEVQKDDLQFLNICMRLMNFVFVMTAYS